MHPVRAVVLFAGMLAVGGCATGEGDGPLRLPDEGADVAVVDAGLPVLDVGGGAFDSGVEGRGFGEQCGDNAECASTWCVAYNDVNVCTRRCLDNSQCPPGWPCLVVSNTAPDSQSVCVPPDGRLCRVCVDSEGCPAGACVELDGQPVCGVACDPGAASGDDGCPPGYLCGEVESVEGESVVQCVPATGSCSCTANTDNDGERRTCEVVSEAGRCRGTQLCDGVTGWGGCDAVTPTVEVCDGKDNDCNGFVDDVAGVGAACEVRAVLMVEGPDGEPVEEERACEGVRRCGDRGLECSAAAPTVEACNGRDDDCDGFNDEGFPLDVTCALGVGACRRAGVQRCAADGAGVVCGAMPGAPVDEVCNGVDDDCDGSVDEGFAGLGEGCSAGIGVCQRGGVRVCGADGSDVVCSAVPGLAGDERCDGADNDCDGPVDEGFMGLGTPCGVGVGLCARQGVGVCGADGASVVCDVDEGEARDEVCDRLDNDCDGSVDEAYPMLGAVCQAGVGACLRQGVQVCAASEEETVCTAVAGAPGDDVCNGVDDDCDGSVDEAFPERNRPCAVGEGVCRRAGVMVCGDDGMSLRCDAEAGEGGAEVCNGIDDDCDGVADETWPLLGRSCDVGRGLCRRSGVYVCDVDDPSAVACDAERVAGAAADRCDYQDDDCDGSVDEGFVDAAGRYVTLANCGACGTDCAALWDPSPEAFGVVPLCVAAGGGAQCGFECLEGRRDADGVGANGCELVVDEDAVYVATRANGGADGDECGGLDAPCASIGAGLARAEASGAARVRVGEGVYRERVVLRAGIDLLGGHQRRTWIRDPALNVTIIDGRTPAGERHRWTVRAEGIAVPTRFEGFTVNGESPLVGGNAYGVYVLDSTAALVIADNRIFSGNGGRGEDGASGVSGAAGRPGGDGSNSRSTGDDNPCFVDEEVVGGGDPTQGFPGTAGGAGGAQVCGGVAVDGGSGGYTTCPLVDGQQAMGASGVGPTGGEGGDGGWDYVSRLARQCDASDVGSPDPEPGDDGGAGGDGVGGGGGAGAGLDGGHWVGAAGAAGEGGAGSSGFCLEFGERGAGLCGLAFGAGALRLTTGGGLATKKYFRSASYP